MILSHREWWTLIHGILLGGFYLLSFTSGIVGLWSLLHGVLNPEGLRRWIKALKIGFWGMSTIGWCTVILGSCVIYVWYRDLDPMSPRMRLLANPEKVFWHKYGMEWKEHLAWMAPMLTTTVAFLVSRYEEKLIERKEILKIALNFLLIAFMIAMICGLIGALLNKEAPIL